MAETTADISVAQLLDGIKRRRRALWFCGAVAIVALANYAWTLRDLALGWISEGRVVLGLAVVVGTIFLVRDRWEEVRSAPVKPSKWGLVFLALSLLLLFIGTRAGLVFVQGMTSVFLRGLSLVVLLCGTVILLLGWQAMRSLWMPALLLIFIYPENAVTAYWVPLRLQTLAAVLGEKAVALLGIPVVRQGHVLETAAIAANVEEACSGIRSLVTVVPAAIFISAYGLGKPLLKVALIALSIPVVLLANIVRVVVTVLMAVEVSREAAQGFFHYFAGLGMFVFCLVILLVIWQALQHAERALGTGGEEKTTDGAAQPAHRTSASGRRSPASLRAGLAVAAFCGLGVLYQGLEVQYVYAAERRHASRPLASIPARIGKWTGEELPDPTELDRHRHVSDALFRVYRAPGEPPINVTLMYWRTGEGTFLGRRAHLPEGCYPYHGMAQRWSRTQELRIDSEALPAVTVTTSSFSMGDGAVIVTSWQQAGLGGEPIPRRAYSGKMGQLVYGLREILRIGSDYPAELALQLSTSQAGPEERIALAQKRFGALLIGRAADLVLADSASGG